MTERKPQDRNLNRLILSAAFLAIGMVLPFLTGQIRMIGSSLLPMHIPVILCGLLCGPRYGLAIGFLLPILRSVFFGMPLFYPNALSMAFELAAYGLVIGVLYLRGKKKSIGYLYVCLIAAMLSGRIVWGGVMAVLLGVGGSAFTVKAFLAGAFLNAVPGIILQLVLIPAVMGAVWRLDRKKQK